MADMNSHSSMPSVFSPLAKALLDGFSEGVVVFDAEGKILYANQQARSTLSEEDLDEGAQDLMPRLAAIGGRLRPLRIGSLEVGEAMFIP
ncbi:MAG TPA: PAS domain-containing protein, partial [Gemmatimonadales bacterium]|nr:PAS domain-containing protein [Gemmatimonadales bacterium]